MSKRESAQSAHTTTVTGPNAHTTTVTGPNAARVIRMMSVDGYRVHKRPDHRRRSIRATGARVSAGVPSSPIRQRLRVNSKPMREFVHQSPDRSAARASAVDAPRFGMRPAKRMPPPRPHCSLALSPERHTMPSAFVSSPLRGWESHSGRRASGRVGNPSARHKKARNGSLCQAPSVQDGAKIASAVPAREPAVRRALASPQASATFSGDNGPRAAVGPRLPVLAPARAIGGVSLATGLAHRVPMSVPRIPATPRDLRFVARPPAGVARARMWSSQVECMWRYQRMGWRDAYEYEAAEGVPSRWSDSGLPACLRSKVTGAYVYFRHERECPDRLVGSVKMFRYD